MRPSFLAPHPPSYQPILPSIFSRTAQGGQAVSRQVGRREWHKKMGGSLKGLSRSRTLHNPANAAALETLLNSTAAAGDVIIVPEGIDWAVNITGRANLGVTANDKIILTTPNYATNFRRRIRAIIGTDDAKCATLHIANGGATGTPVFAGFQGSWIECYGVRFDSDRDAGAATSVLVNVGSHPLAGSIYSNYQTAQAGTTTSITLSAGETFDWGSQGGANIIIFDSSDRNVAVALHRRHVNSYNPSTKVAQVDTWNDAFAPTAGTFYSMTYYDINGTKQGKASFYHCLFDGATMLAGANSGSVLSFQCQGLIVEDCDIRNNNVNPGGGCGEPKGITTSNSKGPFYITNTRIKNSAIGCLLLQEQTLEDTPAGGTFNFCFFTNDEDRPCVKTLFEIKGGQNIIVKNSVFKGSWPDGGQTGSAFNLSQVDAADTRMHKGHRFQWCYVYDTHALGGTGSAAGSNPFVMEDVAFENILALVSYDPRDGSDATNPAFAGSLCRKLTLSHITFVGNRPDKLLATRPVFLVGVNSLPDFNAHGIVACENRQAGFVWHTDQINNTRDGMNTLCGENRWSVRSLAMALSQSSSLSNYTTFPFDGTHMLGDGSAEGVGQTALNAIWNSSTYQVTSTAYRCRQCGKLDGVDVAQLMARVAGVEAGTPTWPEVEPDERAIIQTAVL